MLLDLEPGRHGDRALVHVHHHAPWPSPGRARGSCSATSSRRPSASTRSTSPRCWTTRCGPSCSVHYAGVACDIDGIRAVLRTGPDVGAGRGQRPRALRPLARRAARAASAGSPALSFHETKNFICGEGGALVLNDAADVDRARVLYDKGTNRRAFLLGQVDKYSWQRHRLVVRARRRARRVPARAARAARDDPGQAPRRSSSATSRRSRRAPTSSASRLPVVPTMRAGVPHVLRAAARPRRRATPCSRPCAPQGVARDVPLRPAAQLGRRPAVRGRARPSARSRDRRISGRLLRLPFFTSLTEPDLERVVRAFLRRRSRTTHGPSRSRRVAGRGCGPPGRAGRRRRPS